MICFKCGAEIPEGSTICPVCHADLTLEFAQIDPQETGSVSGGGSRGRCFSNNLFPRTGISS